MSLALAQPKPRVSLAAVNLDSVYKIREWVKDPYYAEYFRRYAPEFTWGDDAAVAHMHSASFFIRVDDEIVGMVGFANYDQHNKQIEYGLLMEKNCPDKVKVIFESGDLVKDYVFNYLNLEKIFIRVLTHRKEIKRILIMNGFKLDGILRKNVYWNGEMHDEWLFTQLKGEWL